MKEKLYILKHIMWALILLIIHSSCGYDKNKQQYEFYAIDDSTQVTLKDTIETLDIIVTEHGDSLDNNGLVCDIRKKDGKLPKINVVAPLSSSGQKPEIVKIEKRGDALADRLNITLLNDSANIDSFSILLSKKFDRNTLQIVGVNRILLALQVKVESKRREELKEAISDSMRGWNLRVENDYIQKTRDYGASKESKGWHLNALKLKDVWSITKGSPNITIAIVDDGIKADHPMFEKRIVKPYNIFTRTNQISEGKGHGTHVAGIAAGDSLFYDTEGAAGIAPGCKIMPVQVFDNNATDCMALITGVIEAIDHGAEIINVSAGKDLSEFSILTVKDQESLSNDIFVDEEILWNRACNYAQSKNAIIVFSAGNDNVVSILDPHNRNDYSITVCSVGADFKSSKFTNYGRGSDISAYGEAINSSSKSGSFEVMYGTSMSAPIVSGTIALMRSISPKITANKCLEILKKNGITTDKYTPSMVSLYPSLKYLQLGNDTTKKITDNTDGSKILKIVKKNNDWDRESLKGKVRKVTTYTLSTTSNWEKYETMIFDENGFITEEQYFKFSSKAIHTFNHISNSKERILFDDKGNLSDKTIEKYDNNGNLIEVTIYLRDNSIFSKCTYKHNTKGDLTERNDLYPNLNTSSKYKYSQKYDAKGNNIETLAYCNGQFNDKTIMKYDKNGNCVKSLFYNSDGKMYREDIKEYNIRGNITKKKVKNLAGLLEGNISYYLYEYEYYE